MARKKITKPLFSVKHDFYDSLDACLDRAVVLHQAVSMALTLKAVDPKVAPTLQEALDGFSKALLTDDTAED